MVKLIGYKRFTSKKSVETCIAQVIREVTEREKQAGAVGQVCDEIFLPPDQVDMLKPSDLGHELLFTYEMSGGRPYLTDVKVK